MTVRHFRDEHLYGVWAIRPCVRILHWTWEWLHVRPYDIGHLNILRRIEAKSCYWRCSVRIRDWRLGHSDIAK
jgi:hypothetical protein